MAPPSSGTYFRSTASTVFRLRDRAGAFVRAHGKAQTIVLIIGIISILTVIGSLFVSLGDTPNAIYVDAEVPPVDSSLFATSLSSLVNAPVGRGGTVTVLNNGDEFLPALIQALDGAKRTINFSVFIWRDGEFSQQVLAALARARRRNVAVRVLLDDYGAKDVPDSKFSELKDAGGRVEKFRTPQLGKLTRLHKRNHRRAIVIDGDIGFTGGMAVGDTWLGDAQDPEHWRDMMFKVTGPLAASLQSAFVSSWVGSSGEILVGSDMYRGERTAAEGVASFIHLVNSPASDDHSMSHFFILSILAARKSVYIVTPYFIPDRHLKTVLQEKAKAGVDVRLLLPGKEIDYQVVRLSAQSHYEDLLRAGVRIYEYRPTFLHSKFAVVDGEWSIIGSANLNSRSRQLDEENAYGVLDPALSESLTDVFFADLEQSDEFQLDEWQRRNVFLRIAQRLAQLLDKQS